MKRERASKGAHHAIRVASKLSGISPETLRMWERRYGFPNPERTHGGSRAYTDDDIARLRLVVLALRGGYRPNEVVALPPQELTRLLAAFETPATTTRETNNEAAPTVESVIAALAADDVAGVRSGLRLAALALGAKRFVSDFVVPFFVRVGEAWSRGELDVRHEHLASECTSTQLRLLLSTHEDAERSPVVVLATFPDEEHSLGIEMIATYLAASGAAPRLLGQDTPPKELANAARAFGANAVGVSISATSDVARASRNLAELALALPKGIEIWVGGANARHVKLPKRARVVDSFAAIDDAIKKSPLPLLVAR